MSVLVVDVGSSSTRAILFSDQAHKIPDAEVTILHQFVTVPSGASIIEVEVIQRNIEDCISQILSHPEARNVRAVGFDTFVGNVLGVDANGVVRTPVYTYADTRCSTQVHTLAELVNVRSVHQRTGCWLHTAYLPARLLWLRQTQPELFESVSKWIDIGTYLYQQWFDNSRVPTSYSAASWNGLLNRFTATWDEEWLNILRIPVHKLADIQQKDLCLTGLNNDYTNKWSLLRNVPFYLSIGDGFAANVGSGCIDRSHIALTVGTTAAIRIADTTFPNPVPEGLWSYRATENLHLTGGATSEGGNIFQWIYDTFGIKNLNQILASREPGSHGLTILPLLNGERSPGWNNHAVGTFHGLRLSTSSNDIAQALAESIALRLSRIMDKINPLIAEDAIIIAGGGIIHNYPAWTQLLADTINRPIHVTNEHQTTARGTAILTLNALGLKPEINPAIAYICYPNYEHTELLLAAKQRQDELYQTLYIKKD